MHAMISPPGNRLDELALPEDLHNLDAEELAALASEIRERMIESLAKNGGHLSPNLGVVELAIALHRSFNSGADRIVWDVGHQAYAHKMLTGRAADFDGLRQLGGMSGYPSRQESPHDVMENSHASTSISYAMGLAAAREEDDDSYVVAVIGDGALTGGMAYEALNHLAQDMPPRVVVVINDNGRSYDPTVGGLARHLAALRVDRRYEGTKKAIGRILRDIPLIGEQADEVARRLKESVKQLVQPSNFFDVLGLKYAGPIDGHDLEELERTFARAKSIDEPVVIHVVTEKGRGYPPALDDEENDMLHAVRPFDISTGRQEPGPLTYTDVFGAALEDIAERRPDVVAITAAMLSSTGLGPMNRSWPERVIDVGLCEQHAVTLAAGLAMSGARPVVAIYSTFLQRAIDQVMLDVALHDLPVVFAIDRAGITGPDGASHHGMFDLSYLRMVPGMRIAAPADELELCRLLETAVAGEHPTAIRFPKASADLLPPGPYTPFAVGEWEEIRKGGDVALVAAGRMVQVAAKAAPLLEERDISTGILNARWVKPLDPRLVEWADRYKMLVTIEDNVVSGGLGSAVLEALSQEGLAGKVRTLGLADDFQPSGNASAILTRNGLDAESIAESVAGYMSRAN
jgi:1-deoxy-D-xylulose-5-phosphate synthase